MRVESERNPWLLTCSDGPVRLVCFHAAGFQPTVFMPWKRYLPRGLGLCAVVLPMHGSRIGERMMGSFQEIAARFVAENEALFDRPCILFGHSMGAMIAYETARILQRRQRPVRALIVSGAQSPDRREVLDRTIGLPESAFLDTLRAYGSISEELLANREFLDYYLPIARTDFALCESYEFSGAGVLGTPIHTFNGALDNRIARDGVEQWRRFTDAPCVHHVFAGGHFYCDEDPAAVCACIGEIARGTAATGASATASSPAGAPARRFDSTKEAMLR